MTPRSSYVRDYPNIKGLSEIHIFLQPLDPDNETVAKYERAVRGRPFTQKEVEEFNKTVLEPEATFQMKACVLCLNYRKLGDITVLQSSRYIYSNDEQEVINQTYSDGQWFATRGFTLLRHKIECITTCKGVPQTGDDWKAFPKRYFEFHIRVCPIKKTEDATITESEIEELKQISNDYSDKYRVPIPLSYNKSAKARQRYLNVRFANCNADFACGVVDQIKQTIEQSKTCSDIVSTKYVWYDDNRAADNGWIEPTDEEKNIFPGIAV